MAPPARRPPPPALPPLVLHPKTHLSDSLVLTGTFPITLGPYTFLHPRARLSSVHGPITVGAHCIISEKACITATTPAGVKLGDYVVVETAGRVEGGEVK